MCRWQVEWQRLPNKTRPGEFADCLEGDAAYDTQTVVLSAHDHRFALAR